MSDSNTNVAVMQQCATGGIANGKSPLHTEAFLPYMGCHTSGELVIKENALLSHLVIRGDKDNPSFTQGFEKALGLRLPERLQSVRNDRLSLYWIAPDEWLLIAPAGEAFSLEQALRHHIQGHFAVVNVTGGQTLLYLEGEAAVDVLKRSMAYDIHPRHFPPGKVVATTFAKTQLIVCRKSETVWELVVRRSFAHYIALWLKNVIQRDL